MRLIDADAIPWEEHYVPDLKSGKQWEYKKEMCVLKPVVDQMPTVDAVEIDVLEDWLYEIANNNFGNALCRSCLEIVNRLGGLRAFARERKDNG